MTELSTTAVDGLALDADGFVADPTQWREDLVPALAARAGVPDLTDDHWRVIRLMRAEWSRTGSGPAVRALSKTSGMPIKLLYELFPGGPAKTAAKIAGIPKPRGCI